MRRWAWVAVAGVAVVLASREGCRAFRAAACADEIRGRYPAPAGGREAVVAVRNCGATTGYATHVFLARPGERLAGRQGDVLVADSDRGAAPWAPGGGIVLDVSWVAPDSLVLRYDPRTRVFHAGRAVHGVRIGHVRAPRRGA